jgi:two-component system response regulator AtoC
MKSKIFVLEDDLFYSEILKRSLEMNPDNEVVVFNSGEEFKKALYQKPNIATIDFGIPNTNIKSLINQIKSEYPTTEMIVVSGQEDIKIAIDLLKLGVYDYIVKDDETNNRLWQTVNHIKEKSSLVEEVEELRQEVQQKYGFEEIIKGNSKEVKSIFKLMSKAVKSNIGVSIIGETGTGKEVVAKALHFNSLQKKKKFVAVNVAAIPSELIESELFGHEKGAFTGAHERRIGKFEEANKGTLFLDEIGDMDLNMQAKLLRVLQEREVVRVGGNNSISLDVRVICATHRDLLEEVRKGNFRQDLYYRILGLSIELPPLRQRGDDVLILAEFFCEDYCKNNKIKRLKFSKEAKSKLLKYNYPGNVRELKAVVELSVVMADEEVIQSEDINFQNSDSLDAMFSTDLTLRQYTHRIINYLLKKHNDNVIKVAEVLDVGKSTIYRILKDEIKNN